MKLIGVYLLDLFASGTDKNISFEMDMDTLPNIIIMSLPKIENTLLDLTRSRILKIVYHYIAIKLYDIPKYLVPT